MRRRAFSAGLIGTVAAARLGGVARADMQSGPAQSSIGAIKRWVVVMFENRSFDSLLGHLPHIPREDGLIGRDVELAFPGG